MSTRVSRDKSQPTTQSFTPDDLKNSLHGNYFQLKLLMIAAIQAYDTNNKKLHFDLITEAQEFKHFNDLVIDYGDRITFLQAKHTSKVRNGIFSKNDFCKDSGDASLAKYFDSWFDLKDSKYTKKDDGASKETKFIFFTNKGVEQIMIDCLEKKPVKDDEFKFETGDTFRIKPDRRDDFIRAILAFSEKIELTNSDNEKIDIKDLNNEKKKGIDYLNKIRKPENKKKKPGSIKIDGRSKLDMETRALIKLCIIDSSVSDILFQLEPELKKWFEEKKEQIEVDITNPKTYLAPSDNSIEMINKFLNEFIIKLNQPNNDMLNEIIIKKINDNDKIKLCTKEMNNAFYFYMSEWFANFSKCLLNSDNLIKFLEKTEYDHQRFYLMGNAKNFLDNCETNLEFLGFTNFDSIDDLKIRLPSVPNLDNFLIDRENNSIAKFIDKGSIELQLYMSLKSISLRDDQWSFLHLSSKYIHDLSNIFEGESSKLCIIDCRNVHNLENNSNLENICNSAIANKKKLILLLNENQTISANIKNTVEIESKPLTDDNIERLSEPFENKYVSLGQKDYKIADIIKDKNCGVYELMRDANYLQEILKNLKVNEDIVKSEMPYDVYIPNEIIKFYDLSILFQKIAQSYCFIADNINGLKSIIKDYLQGQTSDFNITIIAENNYSLDNIDNAKTNIFIILNKELILKELQDKLKNLNFILLKTNDNNRFEEKDLCDLYDTINEGIILSEKGKKQDSYIRKIIGDGNLSLLISPAGYGKTSFCKNIVEKFKTLQNWIIKITLSELKFENGNPILDPFLKMKNTHMKWEKKAYEKDKKENGRVLFILDGFDEVKDIDNVKFIKEWISQIPKEISVLITTRDYAANELSRLTDRTRVFYKLAEYTEEQRDKYLKEYIEKFLKENSFNESKLNDILGEIKNKMSTVNLGRVLGIPLESYIFCESLKPQIIRSNLTEIKKIDVGNLVKLYQQFIISKSRLYFEKMKCIISDDDSQLLIFMGTSNQIIELYALWQAFSLQKDIKDYTQDINFDLKNLISLNHMGILRVIDGRLVFNHETYQEFYASLAIIRGILKNRGELFELVKNLVQNNRYDPKYSMIFSFASQFSFLSKPAMVPGYKFDKHFMSFWNLLGDDGDVYGAAALSLFKSCISELTDKEKESLLRILKEKEWSKFIKQVIRSESINKKGVATIDQEEIYPSYLRIGKEKTKFERIDLDFEKYRKLGNLTKTKIEELEKKTLERNQQNDSWWAYYIGIDAVACTGKFFSHDLAKYLKRRSEYYPNNEILVISALETIFQDIDSSRDVTTDALKNCFWVIKEMFLSKECIRKQNMPFFKRLLSVVDYKFLKYLKSILLESIFLHESNSKKSKLKNMSQLLIELGKCKEINLTDIFKNPAISIFSLPIQMIQIILFIVKTLEYGILFDNNASTYKLTLIKSETIEIEFSKSNASEFMSNYLDLISILLKKSYDPNTEIKDRLKGMREDQPCFFIFVQQYLMKSKIVFDKYFKQISNKDELLNLFKILYENKSLNEYHVKIYKSLHNNEKFKKYLCLIEIAGYTRFYFDSEISEYLIKRSVECDNSAKNSIEALQKFYCSFDSLSNVDIKNDIEKYNNAAGAYNECLKKLFTFCIDNQEKEFTCELLNIDGSNVTKFKTEGIFFNFCPYENTKFCEVEDGLGEKSSELFEILIKIINLIISHNVKFPASFFSSEKLLNISNIPSYFQQNPFQNIIDDTARRYIEFFFILRISACKYDIKYQKEITLRSNIKSFRDVCDSNFKNASILKIEIVSFLDRTISSQNIKSYKKKQKKKDFCFDFDNNELYALVSSNLVDQYDPNKNRLKVKRFQTMNVIEEKITSFANEFFKKNFGKNIEKKHTGEYCEMKQFNEINQRPNKESDIIYLNNPDIEINKINIKDLNNVYNFKKYMKCVVNVGDMIEENNYTKCKISDFLTSIGQHLDKNEISNENMEYEPTNSQTSDFYKISKNKENLNFNAINGCKVYLLVYSIKKFEEGEAQYKFKRLYLIGEEDQNVPNNNENQSSSKNPKKSQKKKINDNKNDVEIKKKKF
ncbi:unnamed protein product [Brachionus calyciflorus]|uniref:NACHT domain-containing protein n=1 Tax=Brachionus calyciflorus TaxID=104777 RepID=A0A813NTF7_9BILA|nr:unnamed protein product [Brachionus calyciflorus]